MKRRPSKSTKSGRVSGSPRPWEEVRQEKVEQARKLVADPNYPPQDVNDAVAKLLAKHLEPERE